MTTEIDTITETLRANAEFLVGSHNEAEIAETAAEWLGLDIDGWTSRRCFRAASARALIAAGVTPDMLDSLDAETEQGEEQYGYRVANGDTTAASVRRDYEAWAEQEAEAVANA